MRYLQKIFFLIILASLCNFAWVDAETTLPMIRVGLAIDQTSLCLPLKANECLVDRENQESILASGDLLIITGVAGKIWINDRPLGAASLLLVADQELLTWNDQSYRGDFLIVAQNNKVTLINQLPLEQYIQGVLPGEMPTSWSLEALKAQAVAARTYTLATLTRHAQAGFDLCASTHCQMYVGASLECSSTNQAVAETEGKVLTYQGQPITAFYHAASGGKTSAATSIWGQELPYLQAVIDWDQNSPHNNWQRNYAWEQLQGMAARSYPKLGRLTQLLPLTYTDGKLARISCRGDLGEVILTGEQFRAWLGLPSSHVQVGMVYGPEPLITLGWFADRQYPEASMLNPALPGGIEILSPPWDLCEPYSWLRDKEPQFLMLKGSGWGHGVGLSQWGAKGMADFGYLAEQILAYYYPGTVLMKLQDLSVPPDKNIKKETKE